MQEYWTQPATYDPIEREELRQRKRPSYKLLSEEELANALRTIEQEWHAKGGNGLIPSPMSSLQA